MSLEVSISRRDVYTADGTFDTSVYEIQANEDGEFIQDLQLETAAELVALRDALSHFIDNNISQPEKTLKHEP